MAFSSSFVMLSLFALLLALSVHGQLSDEKFYKKACPSLHGIVRSTMAKAVAKEPRMGASILRLFFHDCFVNVRYVNYSFFSIVSTGLTQDNISRYITYTLYCRAVMHHCFWTTHRRSPGRRMRCQTGTPLVASKS